jgi:hypothetical protein
MFIVPVLGLAAKTNKPVFRAAMGFVVDPTIIETSKKCCTV